MRTIVLHGHLADFGESYEFDVTTAAEAIRFLGQIDGFLARLSEGAYHVISAPIEADVDDGLDLDESEVSSLRLGDSALHIIPMIAGSKRGGVLKAVLGVALVGAALFFSGGALATPLLGGIGTYGNIAAIGFAAAMQGVSTLLTPKPKQSQSSGDDRSFLNSGPSNNYEQGGAVPIAYGRGIIGGVLISSSLDVERF